MKHAWTTDIHLNFLDITSRKDFYNEIIELNTDGVFISGDIGEAPSVDNLLLEMGQEINKPLYFVLGNHDYYRSDIQSVREKMNELTQSNELLNWLPVCNPIDLSNGMVLIGVDGWADGRYGDYENTPVSLVDSRLIIDLYQQKSLGKYPLLTKMQSLADDDASQLQIKLQEAAKLSNTKKIIVLTHIPPFPQACMHEGKQSDDDWLPFFSSKATGDVLLAFAKKNPEIKLLVLCGHTHSDANYQPMDNLEVRAGAAEYYYPVVNSVIAD